ncbi:MAG: hypothetical protein JXR91_17285 [Deltaproteobacteria bacterium]|nr:hypothetical protein [Deltaproteobacteria bacterium]
MNNNSKKAKSLQLITKEFLFNPCSPFYIAVLILLITGCHTPHPVVSPITVNDTVTESQEVENDTDVPVEETDRVTFQSSYSQLPEALHSVDGAMPEEHPLMQIMLETQEDWVEKLKAMNVAAIDAQPLEFPLHQNNRKYNITTRTTDDSTTVALWLERDSVDVKELAKFEVADFIPVDNRAECLNVLGYFITPNKDRIIVIVTYYIGWENVNYHLFSIPTSQLK